MYKRQQEEHPLLDTVKEALPAIQKGIYGTNPSSRVLAVNQVLLKIWKYLYEILQKMETEQEKEEEDSQNQEAEDKEEPHSTQQPANKETSLGEGNACLLYTSRCV